MSFYAKLKKEKKNVILLTDHVITRAKKNLRLKEFHIN